MDGYKTFHSLGVQNKADGVTIFIKYGILVTTH